MNIGIVVEGDRDGAAYPEIIRKIRPDIQNVRAVVCGDLPRLKRTFIGWIKHFEWHADFAAGKVLVIVDSDCADAAGKEAQLEHAYQQSHFVPSFAVHFHATKCELESWLLADENAVNCVSQNRGKNQRARAVDIELERHRNAKELFFKTLSKAGLPADPQVYKEVAEQVDIERIGRRCPSFALFAAKIRA